MPETVEASSALSPSMQVSRELVALMKDYLGRGPSRARTSIRDDLVVCVLRDNMGRAEMLLAQNGHQAYVRQMRRLFQETVEADAVAIVERNTGRRVVSFMSDHDVERDIAVELFLLGPASERVSVSSS